MAKSIFNKIEDAIDENPTIAKIGNSINQTVKGVQGSITSLRERFKDPKTRKADKIRAKVDQTHRFDSFADEKRGCFVKWHICGHDYFWAVSEMLDSAKESIFIMDWWLSPELYLRRPPASYPQWRLDRLLKRKAEVGVKIYVIVYKEVPLTSTMDSAHTKHALEALHPNIACMRHPDHVASEHITEVWSHHEKVVVVDNQRATIGGLDLCFGRWDTRTHPLADAHHTRFDMTLFPGQDYNNARFMDFQAVGKFNSNEVSTLEIPRMPWQDVHMTLMGPVVSDITQHFTERWNKVKKEKYASNERYAWLPSSRDSRQSPSEDPHHRQKWGIMGTLFRERRPVSASQRLREEDANYYGNCNVQVVRSVSEWSHGIPTEHSIQNAYIDLIMQAEHFIYIENQYFISNTGSFGPVRNLVAQGILAKILQKAKEKKKFKVIVIIPELPGFSGAVNSITISTILAAQWRTINRGGHSIYEGIKAAGFEPRDYIRFYHLRAYDRINGPPSLIHEMEQNSGVSYYQAQVALSRQWLGTILPQDEQGVGVRMAIPQANTRDEKSLGAVEAKHSITIKEYPLPKTEDDAKKEIARFEAGAPRSDKDVSDTIGQHAQIDITSLKSEKWLGTEQEEKDAIVAELAYVHTKLMIIDDRKVIMGSANLNDRSMRGDGDSEICLVVEDQDVIPSTMDGKPYEAAQFAATLRRKLFRTHLGLVEPDIIRNAHDPVTSFMRPAPIPNDPEDDQGPRRRAEYITVIDPLSDEFQVLWDSVAQTNRSVYTEVFRAIPSDLVRSWAQYKNFVPKVKMGHVADSTMSLDHIKDRLSSIRGHIVEAPLNFLIDEKNLVENLGWDGLNPVLSVWI